tara:strand:- start:36 stop:392 length:357 start_codon:yes stop_codon:yes gene_type:complete
MKNDNKLIAEFMGVNPTILGDEITYEMYGIIDCIEDGLDEQHFFLEEELMFHDSWDWLMPVVEKIESDERYDVDILQYGTRITDNQKEIVNNIANISFDKKIDHTYQAVVEFINEYNN